MKRKFFEFVLLSILILFAYFDLKSQTTQNQDSLISIKKIKTFLISNPAPQYVVEIRNDRTISFYNILPENFSEDHPGIEGWLIDSTTIKIDNSDFINLEKTISKIDLENINKIKKPNSENRIEEHISGGGVEKYIIELTNQKIESIITTDNETSISASLKEIRTIVEQLEDKYKPKK